MNLPRTPLLALLCSLQISSACTHLPDYIPAILCALVVTYDLHLCIRYYHCTINIYLSSVHNHLCLSLQLPRHHYSPTSHSLLFLPHPLSSLLHHPSPCQRDLINQVGSRGYPPHLSLLQPRRKLSLYNLDQRALRLLPPLRLVIRNSMYASHHALEACR